MDEPPPPPPYVYPFKLATATSPTAKHIDVVYSKNHDFSAAPPPLSVSVEAVQKFSVLADMLDLCGEDSTIRIPDVKEAALDAVLCCASPGFAWKRDATAPLRQFRSRVWSQAIRLAEYLGASDDVFSALDDGIGRYQYVGERCDEDHIYLSINTNDLDLEMVDRLRLKIPYTWALFCSKLVWSHYRESTTTSALGFIRWLATVHISSETLNRLWYITEMKTKYHTVCLMMPEIQEVKGMLVYKRCDVLGDPEEQQLSVEYECQPLLLDSAQVPACLRAPLRVVEDPETTKLTFNFFPPHVPSAMEVDQDWSQGYMSVKRYGWVTNISINGGWQGDDEQFDSVNWYISDEDDIRYTEDGVMQIQGPRLSYWDRHENRPKKKSHPKYFTVDIEGHTYENGRDLFPLHFV